jgi:hypothetical protein
MSAQSDVEFHRPAATVEQSRLDERHRDRNGELAQKHGNAFVSTLRRIYGPGFAPGSGDSEKLFDALHKLDEPSLAKLAQDFESGELEAKIKRAR